MNKYIYSLIGLALLAGVVWLIMTPGKHGNVATLSSHQVALTCTTDMATKFHIHPHLEIIINGVGQEIPADTGITYACMHPIHTHDTSGTLHIESPVQRDFTLGDFFAVWEKPFSKDEVLGYKADSSHNISVSVNGKVVDTYESTVLYDKDQIIISYESKK